MISFFRNLDSLTREASSCKNEELVSFCSQIRKYIMSADFTKYKKAKEILSYWGEPDSSVALMVGMKESTVRVTRRNLSIELYEKFGYDFFTLLEEQSKKSLEEGKFRFEVAKDLRSASSFIPFDILNAIRLDGSMAEEFDIKECGDEIRFLVKYSKQNIERELGTLDKNKLMYLTRMLDGLTGSPAEIYKLIRLFIKTGKSGG